MSRGGWFLLGHGIPRTRFAEAEANTNSLSMDYHQSMMRPKRAWSWNITLGGKPLAAAATLASATMPPKFF
jgi:hypothetical protein